MGVIPTIIPEMGIFATCVPARGCKFSFSGFSIKEDAILIT